MCVLLCLSIRGRSYEEQISVSDHKSLTQRQVVTGNHSRLIVFPTTKCVAYMHTHIHTQTHAHTHIHTPPLEVCGGDNLILLTITSPVLALTQYSSPECTEKLQLPTLRTGVTYERFIRSMRNVMCNITHLCIGAIWQ